MAMTLAIVQPTFSELTRAFARIGCLSFGGPAGQIALMHRDLVEDQRWIEEGQFLRALNFCHLLPGPEAQQLATYIGWKIAGVRGGVAAGLLFVIPGALVIFALSLLYVTTADASWFAPLFLGIKAAVLAIVAQALIRIGKRALDSQAKVALALAAFVALALFNLPFPLVIVGAGVIGALLLPDGKHAPAGAAPPKLPVGQLLRGSLRTILIWGAIWAVPFVVIALTLGTGHVLFSIATFFSRLAVVTFGGAYAVLSYMAQEAVQSYGWLSAGEMADGLGLAETTPGPLIMVTQFVGFIGAMRDAAPFAPLVAGLIGGLVATWVTFAPCFLFIFTLAPWVERLEHARRLQRALSAVTAAVVGVIANLAWWFTLHVLFGGVARLRAGPIDTLLPDPATVNLWAVAIAGLALALTFVAKRSTPVTLSICAAAGLLVGTLS